MRHSNSGRKLSRTPAHRKALLHNLAKALLIHGKIRTTEMKAKELRRVVEPLITLAKRNDLHSRRLAYRVLNDHALVKRLFDEIGPLFAGVPGGYTRVLKLAMPRKGDNAPMAIIELSRAAEPVADAKAGKDKKAAEILKDYDRVILACGASNPRDIKVPGRELKGIYFAVDFLRATTKSLLDSNFADKKFISTKGKNVMVIGGGDTGNDCVGTSIRLGAKSVIQLEMMPKAPDTRTPNNPWPEWPKICKTDYGQEEAIALFGSDPRIYTTTVKEFIGDKAGNLKKAVCCKLESKKDEKTGRMMMVPIEGSEFTLDVDVVLIAAGFLGSQDYVTKAFGVEVNARTNVNTAPGQYKTNVDRVFTAGDMHRGQSLVVWAIREGREAACAVDLDLMGYTSLQVQ